MAFSFIEALQYAQARKVILPDEFYALDLITRQKATTVKLLSSIEQAEQVIGLVNKALSDGGTFDDFKKQVAKAGIALPEHYLANVFRTNMQSAYSHGRWQQQQRNKKRRPYLQYSAINDNRVRPSHLQMDGVIRHIDDPFWQTHYPPNGYQCRCTVLSLTESQAQRKGITADKDLPNIEPDNGWSSSPNRDVLHDLLAQKISRTPLQQDVLAAQQDTIRIERQAGEKLQSLFAPMTDDSRKAFNAIAEKVNVKDPDIRPSAIKTLIDVLKTNNPLTLYLQAKAISKIEQSVRAMVRGGLEQIRKVAVSRAATVTAVVGAAFVAHWAVGETVILNAPLLAQGGSGEIVLLIENADGLGIDLCQINAGQGVLLPPDLQFKVVGMDVEDGKLIYFLRAIER